MIEIYFIVFLVCVILLSVKKTRRIAVIVLIAIGVIFVTYSYFTSRPKTFSRLIYGCNYTSEVFFVPSQFFFSHDHGLLILRIRDKEGEILLEKALISDYLLKSRSQIRLEANGQQLRISEDIRKRAWISNERFEVKQVEWIEPHN